MSRKRKSRSPARRTRSAPTRRSSRTSNTVRRFVRTVVASGVATFAVVTFALNPQLREHLPLEALWAQFGLPVQEQFAPAASIDGPRVQTTFAECRHTFPEAEPPEVPAEPQLRELCYSAFAILHSGQRRTPVFVAQRLNRRMLAQAGDIERTDRFFADARLPRAERAELDDYRHSGYSRGHMAPAADMHTAEAMAQSFSLANMVPQDQQHNAGPWAKVERDTRKYIERAAGDVYVFTGPYYGEETPQQAGRVAVPTHLFKLVYDASNGRSWVHWQANRANARVDLPISYAEFVRRTGLQLLP